MELRYAEKADYEVFLKMHSEMFQGITRPMPKEKYEEFVENYNIFFLIDQDEILGFTIILINLQDEATIRDIFVREKGKGIGSEFLKLIEKEVLRPNGARNATAHVFYEEPENFWLKNGYEYEMEGTFKKKFL